MTIQIYLSKITGTLTLKNWEDKLTTKKLSTDELARIAYDLNQRQKRDKKMEGYVKELLRPSIPNDPLQDMELSTADVRLVLIDRERAGGLDKDRIQEEMGDNWVAKFSKDPIEYQEFRMFRIEE